MNSKHPFGLRNKFSLSIAAGILGVATAGILGAPTLRLVGLDRRGIAIIENSEKHQQEVFEVGDFLSEGSRLREIGDNYVVVETDGSEKTLYLKGSHHVGDTDAVNLGDDFFEKVPNRFADSERMKHLPQEVLRLESVPFVQGNAIVGLKLLNIPPTSALAQLGLKSGDIVVAIDDRRVRGSIDLLDGIRRSKNAVIELEVERAGEHKRFNLS